MDGTYRRPSNRADIQAATWETAAARFAPACARCAVVCSYYTSLCMPLRGSRTLCKREQGSLVPVCAFLDERDLFYFKHLDRFAPVSAPV